MVVGMEHDASIVLRPIFEERILKLKDSRIMDLSRSRETLLKY